MELFVITLIPVNYSAVRMNELMIRMTERSFLSATSKLNSQQIPRFKSLEASRHFKVDDSLLKSPTDEAALEVLHIYVISAITVFNISAGKKRGEQKGRCIWTFPYQEILSSNRRRGERVSNKKYLGSATTACKP